jgi:hypothetical protein
MHTALAGPTSWGLARSEAQRQVVQRAKQAAGIRPGSKEQRSRALYSAFEAARSKRGRLAVAKKVMGPRSKARRELVRACLE